MSVGPAGLGSLLAIAGLRASDGRLMYDTYQKVGEAMGVPEKMRRDIYGDARDYFRSDQEEDVFEGVKNLNSIGDAYTHVLLGYRIGDSFPKKLGVQVKDLTQAVTHAHTEQFRDELNDYRHNKIGFELRQKYPDDEVAAMQELKRMIINKDPRLAAFDVKRMNTGGEVMNYGDYGRTYK